MHDIRGLLLDLDGVLYVQDDVIPGAGDIVNRLRSSNFPFRFLTNTTMHSRAAIANKLNSFGIKAEQAEIFSTCVVAARWLSSQGYTRLHLLLQEEAAIDFSDFEITNARPDAVVVGDLAEGFTYSRLNPAFRLLKQGARLVALQKNRFWQTRDGLSLDAGPFVAALEYAAETEAVVIGKPSRAYFAMAVLDMGLVPGQVAMVGDDLFTDIKGAADAGLKTILCKTGKFRREYLSKSTTQPDFTISSIANLTDLLGIKA